MDRRSDNPVRERTPEEVQEDAMRKKGRIIPEGR